VILGLVRGCPDPDALSGRSTASACWGRAVVPSMAQHSRPWTIVDPPERQLTPCERLTEFAARSALTLTERGAVQRRCCRTS